VWLQHSLIYVRACTNLYQCRLKGEVWRQTCNTVTDTVTAMREQIRLHRAICMAGTSRAHHSASMRLRNAVLRNRISVAMQFCT
jgi:hypothetical protein